MAGREKIRKHWRFFEKHREELAHDHHGKFVLIYNEGIHAIADSEMAAYKRAIGDGLQRGEFYIRRCVYKREETPAIVRARVNAL